MSFNVLAVSAHFDDAELGCGGALARHARAGDKVYSYVATRSDYKDMSAKTVRSADVARREGIRAAKILGAELIEGSFETFHVHYDDALISELRALIERRKIDTIYLPWTGDAHQDHRAVARAAITAGRHCPRLLMYRINYYDTEENFDARHYVDITRTMAAKLRAIRAHASEHRRTGGKWTEYTAQMDRNTGIKLGVEYAEGFQIVRYLAP
ncbi:MAG TPA: PIG-L deacetylase family protein [Elusimicrobiota bacterium]|nr:PIG-L deacetylase family protein [Elusimicrobiota bacterium]